jgi:hypothetical protein
MQRGIFNDNNRVVSNMASNRRTTAKATTMAADQTSHMDKNSSMARISSTAKINNMAKVSSTTNSRVKVNTEVIPAIPTATSAIQQTPTTRRKANAASWALSQVV